MFWRRTNLETEVRDWASRNGFAVWKAPNERTVGAVYLSNYCGLGYIIREIIDDTGRTEILTGSFYPMTKRQLMAWLDGWDSGKHHQQS
jgi:hypothetical protein